MPFPIPARPTHVLARPTGAAAFSLVLLAALVLRGCSDGAEKPMAQQGREDAMPCEIRPSADNTGASGDLRSEAVTVIEKNGVTLEDARVPSLEIRANNVTLRNVEVAGNILVTGDNATIDHVTTTGLALSSVSGATVQYTEVSGSPEDAIHITSDAGSRVRDVTLRYNYIHSPAVPPGAHYDGTQVRGADGLLVKCSTYDAGSYRSSYNAAIYLEDANGGESNVTIENNWLNGWGFSVMLDAPGTRIIGNSLGGDTRWGSCYLGVGTSLASLDIRDNVNTESGENDPMCAEAAP